MNKKNRKNATLGTPKSLCVSLQRVLALGFALMLCTSANAAPLYSITDLGTLGGTDSVGYGINDLGVVVGNSKTASGPNHAFIYDSTGIHDLGYFGATGINDSGQVAGSITTTTPSGTYETHPITYYDGTIHNLGVVGGSLAINNQGEVVGGAGATTQQAFLYNGAIKYLAVLSSNPANDSAATAINNLGEVVGYSSAANGQQDAFLYDGSSVHDLGALGAYGSNAVGINDSGEITGNSFIGSGASAQPRAFLYDGTGMHDIGTLGGNDSFANGINNSGDIVGAADTSSGSLHAFLYNGGTMHDLNNLVVNNSGWTISTAVAINNFDQITGYGFHNGEGHAFLLTPYHQAPVNPSFAPSLNQLSIPSSLVTDLSTPAICNNCGIPSDVQNWLNQVEIDIGSIQYPQSLKDSATNAANVIQFGTSAIDTAEAVVSGSFVSYAGLGLKLVFNNGYSNTALGSAKIADDLINVALTGATTDNVYSVLITANAYIWGDLVAPQLKQFGKDPTDPNYTQIYQTASAPLSIQVPAGANPSLTEALTLLIQSSYRAAEDLNGANRSYDRYVSAYTNGDAKSALLQIEGLLYYLDLYKEETSYNAALNEKVKALLPSGSLTTPTLNPAWLSAMEQELMANGFSSNMLSLLSDLNVSSADMTNMRDFLLGLTPNDFSTMSFNGGLMQLTQGIDVTTSPPAASSVPEPASGVLLLIGLVSLMAVG